MSISHVKALCSNCKIVMLQQIHSARKDGLSWLHRLTLILGSNCWWLSFAATFALEGMEMGTKLIAKACNLLVENMELWKKFLNGKEIYPFQSRPSTRCMFYFWRKPFMQKLGLWQIDIMRCTPAITQKHPVRAFKAVCKPWQKQAAASLEVAQTTSLTKGCL